MTRWHHGHSTLVGVLLGVSLASHGWLLLVIGFAVGLFAHRFGDLAAAAASWLRRRRTA